MMYTLPRSWRSVRPVPDVRIIGIELWGCVGADHRAVW